MKVPESKTQKTLPPPGSHTARLLSVIDLGTQKSMNPNFKDSRKVKFTWEFSKLKGEFDGKQKPLVISQDYTFTQAEKGKLRDTLLAWLGVDISKDPTFDITDTLGKECILSVNHSDNGEYANIVGVLGIPEGIELPPVENPMRSFSLEKSEFDAEVFEALPKFIKEKIITSPEFKALKYEPKQEQTD